MRRNLAKSVLQLQKSGVQILILVRAPLPYHSGDVCESLSSPEMGELLRSERSQIIQNSQVSALVSTISEMFLAQLLLTVFFIAQLIL